MRIISGSSGGIPLQVPKNVTRPTTERIRGAIFNMLLEIIPDATVLDLFAGSGAYGIESLSRGATGATFVEADRAAADIIRANLAKARLGAQAEVLPLHVDQAFPRLPADTFDLVFADPPYKKHPTDSDHLADLFENPNFPFVLKPRAILVTERFSKSPLPPTTAPWELLQEKNYGDCTIAILRFRPV